MKELKTNELENINGGDWRKNVETIGKIGSVAIGGIQVGVGMASAVGGVVTLNPLLAGAGGALMIDGAYNISNIA